MFFLKIWNINLAAMVCVLHFQPVLKREKQGDFPCHVRKMPKDWQESSVVKGAFLKTDSLNLSSRTHMVEWEN